MTKDKSYTLDYDAFLRSIKQNLDVPHSFLLGAGASITSGVQSAIDCIWEWKQSIYLSQNPNASEYYKNIKNDSVKNSIQDWIDSQGIYPALNSPEEYSYFTEKVYPIDDDRRKYFQGLVEGKEPFIGYKLLTLFAKHDIVKATWTTNFDGLFERAAHKANVTPIVVTLDNVDHVFRNQSKNEVLSIALHGDYKYSSLKNTTKELDNQNDTFIDALQRYHTDKNLIVIGYSGRDKSLMEALKKAFTAKGSGRLYWCGFGHEINDDIIQLLSDIRNSGRDAFYVPTEGFDSTMIHLASNCFGDNSDIFKEVKEVQSNSETGQIETTDFKILNFKPGKYLKSNLHPVVFPKEIYQFEYDFEDNKPWKTIKELTRETDICAVPFKRKVFALGTLSEINEVFGGKLVGDIQRVPISKFDVENVNSFKSLMLQAILKTLVRSKELDSNFKDKLWFKKTKDKTVINEQTIYIHKALFLSLFFDKNSKFASLTLKPTIYINSDEDLSKEVKQSVSKSQLEKLYNKEYDDLLEKWRKYLFEGSRLKFEYPNDSGTGFTFNIANMTSYAEVSVIDPNFKSYQPRDYNKRLTQYKGVQLLEPQLIFTNNNEDKPSKDFHPMRGLKNHRPFDFHQNGSVHFNAVNLGVICSSKYAEKLNSFLNALNQKHTASKNTDYLIDFPGFANAYNIPINIPLPNDTDKWLDIEINHADEDAKQIAQKLGRLITSKIDQIINQDSQNIVVIFIPEEWQAYERYEDDGEVFDLHDYIKAFAASKGVSTQLIREDTLTDPLKNQIYWWLSLSFYVKALRTPWILNNPEKDTAYAGIGYSLKYAGEEPEVVIGCSHIYNSEGQGLKYKLSKVNNFTLDRQSNPYLSYEDAYQFGVSIRELFYRSMDKLPARVVVHKRTRFTDDEVRGITESLNLAGIEKIDLIEINFESDVKFFNTKVYYGDLQIDKFPISRGTCIITNKRTALLWSHGIVPSVKNPNFKYFQGGRSIPAPLKITKHHGESNIDLIASEILGLTKMNWNSFDLYTKLPATINSSNEIAKIGKLLSRFEGKIYDYRLFI